MSRPTVVKGPPGGGPFLFWLDFIPLGNNRKQLRTWVPRRTFKNGPIFHTIPVPILPRHDGLKRRHLRVIEDFRTCLRCTRDLVDYVGNRVAVLSDAVFIDVLADKDNLGLNRRKIAGGAFSVYRCKLVRR